MDKHKLKKTAWFGGLIVIFVILAIIYFNRSYAYIYNHIDNMALKTPDHDYKYLVVNNKAASSTLSYVALGDSLTAGVGTASYQESFPYILAQYFAGNDYQISLKDKAVPGVKTAELLSGLLPGAINENPDIVTLLVGVNDVHGNISKKEFKENYEKILSRLTSETKAKIYVINIPRIGAGNLILPPYDFLFDYRTKQFNKIIFDLAAKYNVKYIDLYTPTADLLKSDGPHYSSDLFHPSAQGYKIWADLIYADISN